MKKSELLAIIDQRVEDAIDREIVALVEQKAYEIMGRMMISERAQRAPIVAPTRISAPTDVPPRHLSSPLSRDPAEVERLTKILSESAGPIHVEIGDGQSEYVEPINEQAVSNSGDRLPLENLLNGAFADLEPGQVDIGF
tara:strand:+ start:5114 stop:5533 length:420 start_codon:yes stop_codon:yes gene_type:complete